MNVLIALLGTMSIFAIAIFLAWLATRGTWGVITLFVIIFMAIFLAILGGLS